MSRCRLKEWYNVVVRPDLMAKMQYTNTHAIPKLNGVSVQVTTKQAATGLDNAVPAAFILELVTGQTAALTRVKNANAMYKVRPGHLEGAKVTLHGDQMYHFLDRMVTQVRPGPQLRRTAGPAPWLRPATSPATAMCAGAAAHHRFQRPQPEVLRWQGQLRSSYQRLELLFGGAWPPTPNRWSLRWRESHKLCAVAAQVEAQHSNLQHLNLQKSPGLGVQIHTTAKTDDEAKLLLTAMRFPFRPS